MKKKITQTKNMIIKKENEVKEVIKKPILKIENLYLGFNDRVTKKYKEVIQDVSFELYEGEILGILGESGSGKTVLASSCIDNLPNNSKIKSGTINLFDVDITHWGEKQWYKSKFRGSLITYVYQNPMKTLNPVMKIKDQMTEAIIKNNRASNHEEAVAIAKKILADVEIKNIKNVLKAYPHQLSGGMIQRIVIAISLATEAQIIIMDEPTTALDPIVQSEIINLILRIKTKFKISFIFITHDIGVMSAVADRILVMYAGRIQEYGNKDEIIWNPQHPYTWNLLMAMPDMNTSSELFTIQGDVPSDINGIKYDTFAPRNNYALDEDFVSRPKMYEVSKTHYAATRLLSKRAPKFKPPQVIMERWKSFADKSFKKIEMKEGQ